MIWHVLGTAVETSFNGAAIRIEIKKCDQCGSNMKVIASIEELEVIKKVLKHLGLDKAGLHNRSPLARADGLVEPATILI
ncbi:MAG: hypothetical protein ACJAX5_002904 [Patiriisocius sp.]|jgi:hypothetical protein